MAPLIELSDFSLSVSVRKARENLKLLNNISFSIKIGERAAIAGESGSGKSTLAHSITFLFSRQDQYIQNGSIRFQGKELVGLSENEFLPIRQKAIRYIFQEPAQALSPILKIGAQFEYSTGIKDFELFKNMLLEVGITEPDRVLHSYPHQISIGMLQRILIAMALAVKPALIIADEPTSSLDPPLRYQILDLLNSAVKKFKTSLLLVTHDLEIPFLYADKIIILYAGRIVENSDCASFYKQPLHPYSRLLLAGGKIEPSEKNKSSYEPISFSNLPTGCKYSNRCPLVQSDCLSKEPILESISEERSVRCLHWK